ncbi:MAG: DUF389 domain-containing protein [Prevotella sp.]|jgi:uncharacterized hydrophobic protein (TIGR00271 family)|nr:DUF389 domain-containing protein [Prevotella sp.]MCH4181659.1 DUF389 domain-containing protein [Prevotella sp.]MCH4211933.1 DUF389 domain-containing protein [Prevotella sp.]MCH4240631.1 DUF389 domain-containing protein [Prevotella sp.]MCI1742170.1 DUF389 domain-containing protein [Prevotella sp.]
MERTNVSLIETLKGYFNIFSDKEDERTVIENITNGVPFRGAQLWILIFAVFIASLGLNVNSTAVVIGAMLISPLMGPIIGMGLAVGINDLALLKSAFQNFLGATIISIITATIYFLLSPFGEAQSELLARTSPTLYDVLIAFCGGAAGFIAIATKGKGNVIPGVAIATALMPPLCTAGYGIAHANIYYFLGAIYLFFINTVFICLSTFLGVRMMKFHRKEHQNPARAKRVRRWIIFIVVITMIPAALMTVHILRESIFKNNVNTFIKEACDVNGSQIISNHVDSNTKTLRLVAVGKEISAESIRGFEDKLADYHLAGYKLQVIQGSQSDSLLMLGQRMDVMSNLKTGDTQTIQAQQNRIVNLEDRLASYTRYGDMTPQIRHEMATLYPGVQSLAITPVAQSKKDTVANYVVAIVGTGYGHHITMAQREGMRKWLQIRIKADSVRLITTNN